MGLQERTVGYDTYSIAICTRGNDAASLVRAVASAVAQGGGCTEVIVVDQGPLPASTLEALEPEGSHPRIRYVRDSGRGVSRARNIALHAAHNEVVVFTDDDCELEPGAAAELASAVAECSGTAIAFGSVVSSCPVNSDGFVPTYRPPRRQHLAGRTGKLRDGGIGACMALRRTAVLCVGGFDERLGPGSAGPPSCEEGELAYRLLRAGFTLAHRPDATTVHFGRRPWGSAGKYNLDTFRGVGAAYSMYAWRGDPVAAALVIQQFGFALAQVSRSALSLKRPRGAKRAIGVLRGAVDGIKLRPVAALLESDR